MALPLYLGHYLPKSERGKYSAVSKSGHTYPKSAISLFRDNNILQKYLQCFLWEGYIGRLADFAFYKVYYDEKASIEQYVK
jgi:hypothetical protein